jgi:hypothetical protein
MQRVFDTVVDRTRSRLDVPKIRTIFGTAQRPRRAARRPGTGPAPNGFTVAEFAAKVHSRTGDRSMRAVFTPLRRMRSSRPPGRFRVVQDVPSPSRSARPAARLPALRQTRLSECRDRMVRVVFTAGPAEGPTENLPGVRRAAPS